MEEIAAVVGRRIRALRKAAGLSQDDLAAKAAMSRVFLSEVERGRKTPSLETLERLGRVMGVALKAFVEDSRRPTAVNPPSSPARLGRRVEVLAQEAPEEELERFQRLAVAFFARYRPRRRRR